MGTNCIKVWVKNFHYIKYIIQLFKVHTCPCSRFLGWTHHYQQTTKPVYKTNRSKELSSYVE